VAARVVGRLCKDSVGGETLRHKHHKALATILMRALSQELIVQVSHEYLLYPRLRYVVLPIERDKLAAYAL
jgi:hypothetical protein